MKEDELRRHAKCDSCGKGIGHTGLPLFWTMHIERFGLDAHALQRQQGLTMMMGGNALLATVLGPDEDMARRVMEPVEVTLCEECAMGQINIMVLMEKKA